MTIESVREEFDKSEKTEISGEREFAGIYDDEDQYWRAMGFYDGCKITEKISKLEILNELQDELESFGHGALDIINSKIEALNV